jgi:hypothetical protein
MYSVFEHRERIQMKYFEDHGLPLVQLKEQRRELVVALSGRDNAISNAEIAKLASLQQTIAAMEAIVDDLDSTIEFLPRHRQTNERSEITDTKTMRHMKLVFGRRQPLDRDLRQNQI